MRNRLAILLPLLALTMARAQQATSPFADKVVDSYSGNTDPVTHQPRVIHWGDLRPDDFGPRSITFSDAGLRSLHPVPAPGAHPRILFTPDDLPALRARIRLSISGQIMYNHLLAYSTALRGHYDEHAPYAQPDLWKGDSILLSNSAVSCIAFT